MKSATGLRHRGVSSRDVAHFAGGGGEFVTGMPDQRDQASRRMPWTICRACQNIRLLLSKVRLDHGQARRPKRSAIVRGTRFRSGHGVFPVAVGDAAQLAGKSFAYSVKTTGKTNLCLK